MSLRMRPTYVIEHVREINIQELKDEGIKALIFDLDNTLMAPKTGEFCDEITNWIDEVRKDFKIAILSNNSDSKYIENIRKNINYPIYGSAKKPSRKVALNVMNDLDIMPNQCAMIGDRPLTDILVGIRLGMITILVDPLIKHQEIRIVKFLRKLERVFVRAPKKDFDTKK